MIQKSLSRLEVRVAVSHPLSEPEEASLRGWIAEHYGDAFEIALSYHDEIPRTVEGKYLDFISEVAD